MSEKRFKTLEIIIEDEIGTTQTCIRSELSAPQVLNKILMLASENEQLKKENDKKRFIIKNNRIFDNQFQVYLYSFDIEYLLNELAEDVEKWKDKYFELYFKYENPPKRPITEKRFSIKHQDSYFGVVDNITDDKVCVVNGIHTKIEAAWLCDLLNNINEENEKLIGKRGELETKNIILKNENEHLRNLIKGNVFQQYEEGSLSDLEYKAIAYDDILNVEMDYASEPKLVIYCKQGTKTDMERYARVKTFNMFIPLGVDFIIKEI